MNLGTIELGAYIGGGDGGGAAAFVLDGIDHVGRAGGAGGANDGGGAESLGGGACVLEGGLADAGPDSAGADCEGGGGGGMSSAMAGEGEERLEAGIWSLTSRRQETRHQSCCERFTHGTFLFCTGVVASLPSPSESPSKTSAMTSSTYAGAH